MQDDGGGGGISGTLDLPGAGVKFQGWWRAFDADISSSLVDDAGRGDSEWTPKLPTSSNGFITISGTAVLDGYPLPTKYRGELGTIRRVHCAAVDANPEVSQTYAVRVRHSEFGEPDKVSREMSFTHVCEVVAQPTLAGYGGTQTASTDETFADKILWAVLATIIDTGGLNGSAKRRIRVWGVGDNDAAEKTKLLQVLADIVAPYDGLKVRELAFGGRSKNYALIDVTFAFTTSDEDVLNEATGQNIDPTGHISTASTAAFNDTPAPFIGLVERGTSIKEFNDGKILHTTAHGTKTPAEEIVFARTKLSTDVSGLSQESLMCKTFVTGSSPGTPPPPDGMVITDYFDIPDTSPNSTNLSIRVYVLSFVTNAEKLTLPRLSNDTDPNGLDTVRRYGVIWNTTDVTEPTDPPLSGVLANFKLDAKTDLSVGTHPTKRIRVYRHAKTDSKDRLELPHNWLHVDPRDVNSHGEASLLNDTPVIPAGYKSRGTKGEYQNAIDVLNITELGINDTKDDIEKGGTWAEGESFGGKKFQTASQVPTIDAASTTMASLFLSLKSDARFRRVRVRQINDRQSEAIVETQTAEIIITGTCENYADRLMLAKVEGGQIYVYLREVVQSGTGLWHYQLAEQPVQGARIRFTIERLVSGTELPLRRDLLRTTNGSAFLGIDPYFCAYLGSGFALNYSIPAPRVSRMRYEFLMDELGFAKLEGASSGWKATTTTLRVIDAETWILASSLGLSLATLDTGDYSGFLA